MWNVAAKTVLRHKNINKTPKTPPTPNHQKRQKFNKSESIKLILRQYLKDGEMTWNLTFLNATFPSVKENA